ncbi:MAG: hypothetical protein ACRDON_11060 [Gaiellaceae bacterium]
MRRLAVARAVAWRTLHNVFTNPSLFIPSLVFPLFFFVAFAGGLSQIDQVPGFDFPQGYTAFQFVFVLLQSAAFGGVFTGFGIARDFESGFARRLLLAAPNRTGIVLGYALGLLINFAAVLWAAGVAMRLRTMQAGPVMQMPVFLILFFAPVYVPLSLLEGWIHAIATVNPVTRVLEAGRGFISGEPTEVAAAFGAALAIGLLLALWAVRGLRSAERAGA